MNKAFLILFSVPALAQVLVNGAGASFPYPIYARWFDEFHRLHRVHSLIINPWARAPVSGN